jgi:hypothetical protein
MSSVSQSSASQFGITIGRRIVDTHGPVECPTWASWDMYHIRKLWCGPVRPFPTLPPRTKRNQNQREYGAPAGVTPRPTFNSFIPDRMNSVRSSGVRKIVSSTSKSNLGLGTLELAGSTCENNRRNSSETVEMKSSAVNRGKYVWIVVTGDRTESIDLVIMSGWARNRSG